MPMVDACGPRPIPMAASLSISRSRRPVPRITMTIPSENNVLETVFILDDDDAVRDSLQILLESAGFTVEAFASPLEFLNSSAPGRAGCLLIDVRMPEMSGIEVQEHLGADKRQLPVIVMTGHADVPLAVRAM